MLAGRQGQARQMAMRLLLDLAAAAGASELVPVSSAHLSGVSPLTGGMGLRRFLARLAADREARVAVPTTLNSAGCDASQFGAMRIVAPDFLAQSQEIVSLYARLGVETIQSCVPYEWDGVLAEGTAAWAESNAICFGNSYCGLATNRESGLSALASALTGYTALYGLLEEKHRRPNVKVTVTAALEDPTHFSILGDWIGRQRQAHWRMPFGPIPAFSGLPTPLSHEQRKALAAAAANYGCPLLYLDAGEWPGAVFQAELGFDEAALQQRTQALRPRREVSLVVIGCPQASTGELQAAARLLRGKRVRSEPAGPGEPPPLWIFTAATNLAIAERTGVAAAIRDSGALLLADTCPEVVPYDPAWVRQVLTNSMKAEHYIQSGLNGIPTAVMVLAECIGVATGEIAGVRAAAADGREPAGAEGPAAGASAEQVAPGVGASARGPFTSSGYGLPSQADFSVRGEAFVTAEPLTLLGYVNRETGVVEEPGHPADGQSLAGKIAIFPRGSGSTVAPYVLLELYYRGRAPLAIVNTELDQQSAPACSLEGIAYAYGFDRDVIGQINHGDEVELRREGERVTITVVERRETRLENRD